MVWRSGERLAHLRSYDPSIDGASIAGRRAAGTSVRLGALAALCLAIGCGGSRPDTLGVSDSRLAACPATSNCVCSDDEAPHFIEPFELAAEPRQAWRTLQETLSSTARSRVVTRTSDYLHAEATSLVFRFVDDVEFHLRAADSLIAVRSASRLGSYDFGVNRRRIESLRDRLREAGAIR